MKSKAKRKARRAASATIRKAEGILKEQKSDYQRIFKNQIKKGVGVKNAAIKAGSIYRDLYGSTPKKRWQNALKVAKERLF